MRTYGPRELVEDVQDKGLCVACGACVDLCPYFRSHKGRIAMLFPCDIPSGRCNAFCPKTEVDLDSLAEHFWGKRYTGEPVGQYLRLMTARAGRKAPKGSFQAGGTVSSLMAFALEEKIVQAAVLTDREGMNPVARLVTRPEAVMACASSKYTAAPTLSAWNLAVHDGYSRMGVVGTPCQVTALAQMRMNPLQRADFSDPSGIVVGLFCTWALDTRALDRFLSSRVDIARIRKMDIPPPPAEKLVIDTEGDRLEIPLNEVRALVPNGCRLCPDMTAEWADVSVGVHEGDPGWNVVLVRTQRGKDLVEEAVALGWLEEGSLPEESREHLFFASSLKRSRALRRAMEEGLVNRPEADGRSCLRIDPAELERIIGSKGGI